MDAIEGYKQRVLDAMRRGEVDDAIKVVEEANVSLGHEELVLFREWIRTRTADAAEAAQRRREDADTLAELTRQLQDGETVRDAMDRLPDEFKHRLKLLVARQAQEQARHEGEGGEAGDA